MSTLVIAEHNNAELASATFSAVAAAKAISGDTDILVAGSGCGAVAEAAAKIPGIGKVLLADSAEYEHDIAENVVRQKQPHFIW